MHNANIGDILMMITNIRKRCIEVIINNVAMCCIDTGHSNKMVIGHNHTQNSIRLKEGNSLKD